jgi:hypothetical protein
MTLRRIGLVACAIALATIAAGARAAASAESVDRLMQAMRVQAQLEMIYNQTLPAMQNAMKQSLGAQLKSDEAQRMYDTVMPRVNAVIREELSWAKLKPDFATIYAETFTQQEIDSLIAFYQGPVGTMLVSKTPQLSQRSMQMMQQRMGPMMQKVMQVAKDEVEKERARSGKKN